MRRSFGKLAAALGAASGIALGAGLLGSSGAGAASGNGVASMPANQIVTTAINATQAVTSLTITGLLHQGHQTIALNVTASSSGQGKGTVTINRQTVGVASTVYMRANATFWRQNGAPAAAANQLAGRWISLPATDASASSITSALNSGNFLSQLPKGSDAGTVFTKVGTGTLNGQPAVKIKATNPTKPDDNGVLYVATTGSPYVLRVTGAGTSSFGTIVFSHFNQPVNVQPPAGAIPISQLEQG